MLDARDLRLQAAHIVRGVCLGQPHDVSAAANRRLKVIEPERGIKRVDSDNGFNVLVQRVLQRMKDQNACRVFLAQCNGVFKIEHDGIGLEDKGGTQHRRVGTRHEQHASTQLHCNFSHSILTSPTLRKTAVCRRARMAQSKAPLSSTVMSPSVTPSLPRVSSITARIWVPN